MHVFSDRDINLLDRCGLLFGRHFLYGGLYDLFWHQHGVDFAWLGLLVASLSGILWICIRLSINSRWLRKYCSCTRSVSAWCWWNWAMLRSRVCRAAFICSRLCWDALPESRSSSCFVISTEQPGIFTVICQESVVGFQRLILPSLATVPQFDHFPALNLSYSNVPCVPIIGLGFHRRSCLYLWLDCREIETIFLRHCFFKRRACLFGQVKPAVQHHADG